MRFSAMIALPALMVATAPSMPKAALVGVIAAKSGSLRVVCATGWPRSSDKAASESGCLPIVVHPERAAATAASTRVRFIRQAPRTGGGEIARIEARQREYVRGVIAARFL
jgi:hypothetical protein